MHIDNCHADLFCLLLFSQPYISFRQIKSYLLRLFVRKTMHEVILQGENCFSSRDVLKMEEGEGRGGKARAGLGSH